MVIFSYFFQTFKNKNLRKSILWDYAKIRNILAVPKVSGSNPDGRTTSYIANHHRIINNKQNHLNTNKALFYQKPYILLKKFPKFFLNRLGVSYGW